MRSTGNNAARIRGSTATSSKRLPVTQSPGTPLLGSCSAQGVWMCGRTGWWAHTHTWGTGDTGIRHARQTSPGSTTPNHARSDRRRKTAACVAHPAAADSLCQHAAHLHPWHVTVWVQWVSHRGVCCAASEQRARSAVSVGCAPQHSAAVCADRPGAPALWRAAAKITQSVTEGRRADDRLCSWRVGCLRRRAAVSSRRSLAARGVACAPTGGAGSDWAASVWPATWCVCAGGEGENDGASGRGQGQSKRRWSPVVAGLG